MAEAELGDTGRVLLRPSGTEPVVRVMVEAAISDGGIIASAWPRWSARSSPRTSAASWSATELASELVTKCGPPPDQEAGRSLLVSGYLALVLQRVPDFGEQGDLRVFCSFFLDVRVDAEPAVAALDHVVHRQMTRSRWRRRPAGTK